MSKRVLVAQSDQTLRESCRNYLIEHGFQVATAAAGPECIDVLRDWQPDVLVLDSDLPEGGAERARQFLAEHPEIPCSALLTVPAGKPDAHVSGTEVRLDKPFSMEDLVGGIHNQIAGAARDAEAVRVAAETERRELNESLQRLHTELARTPSVDAGSRELLTNVLNDIKVLLGPEDNDQHGSQSLASQVKSAIDHFQDTHPTLASMLAQIGDALSSIGI